MARRGFTLIELLIVLTVITVMLVVAVPSFGMIGMAQQSLATKDSLRLMRYARNMALQTQVPVTITFSPETVVIASAFDDGLTSAEASAESAPTAATTSPSSEDAPERPKAHRNRVETETLEAVGLTKRYENVSFEFLGYDDTISRSRSSEDRALDFHRRGIDTEESSPPLSSKNKVETFTITVRANGTTRPFSMRVFPKDNADVEGNLVTFDFLCSGKISE